MKTFEPKPRKPQYNFLPHDSSRAKMRRLRQVARGRVRLAAEAIVDSMKSRGAWRSARKDEMMRLIDDMAKMEEYSCTPEGKGVLALVDDTTPSGAVRAPGVLSVDAATTLLEMRKQER